MARKRERKVEETRKAGESMPRLRSGELRRAGGSVTTLRSREVRRAEESVTTPRSREARRAEESVMTPRSREARRAGETLTKTAWRVAIKRSVKNGLETGRVTRAGRVNAEGNRRGRSGCEMARNFSKGVQTEGANGKQRWQPGRPWKKPTG
jgi:hypothetical protein